MSALALARKLDTRTIMLWNYTGNVAELRKAACVRNISVVVIAYCANARSDIPRDVILHCTEYASAASKALANAHRTFALVCNANSAGLNLRDCYRTLFNNDVQV